MNTNLNNTVDIMNTVESGDKNLDDSILVVDDSRFSRKILNDILKKAGFNITFEAKNGVEAIELTKERKPKYIFLDVEMPVLDGLSALPQILKENPSAYVIMCTAMGQQNVIETAKNVGAKDYVIKPYTKENIINVLKSGIAQNKEDQVIPFDRGRKVQAKAKNTNENSTTKGEIKDTNDIEVNSDEFVETTKKTNIRKANADKQKLLEEYEDIVGEAINNTEVDDNICVEETIVQEEVFQLDIDVEQEIELDFAAANQEYFTIDEITNKEIYGIIDVVSAVKNIDEIDIIKEELPEEAPISLEIIKEELPEEAPVSLEIIKEETSEEAPVSLEIIKEETPEETPVSLEIIKEETPEEAPASLEIIKEETPEETPVSLEIIKEETPEETPVSLEIIKEETPEEALVNLEIIKEETPEETPASLEVIKEEKPEETPVSLEIIKEETPEETPVSHEIIKEETPEEALDRLTITQEELHAVEMARNKAVMEALPIIETNEIEVVQEEVVKPEDSKVNMEESDLIISEQTLDIIDTKEGPIEDVGNIEKPGLKDDETITVREDETNTKLNKKNEDQTEQVQEEYPSNPILQQEESKSEIILRHNVFKTIEFETPAACDEEQSIVSKADLKQKLTENIRTKGEFDNLFIHRELISKESGSMNNVPSNNGISCLKKYDFNYLWKRRFDCRQNDELQTYNFDKRLSFTYVMNLGVNQSNISIEKMPKDKLVLGVIASYFCLSNRLLSVQNNYEVRCEVELNERFFTNEILPERNTSKSTITMSELLKQADTSQKPSLVNLTNTIFDLVQCKGNRILN